jgi:hypothetical protein
MRRRVPAFQRTLSTHEYLQTAIVTLASVKTSNPEHETLILKPILESILLSKTLDMRIHVNTLPLTSCGCKIWSFILMKEHKSGVFRAKCSRKFSYLRRIKVTNLTWTIIRLHLYTSPTALMIVEAWESHLSCILHAIPTSPSLYHQYIVACIAVAMLRAVISDTFLGNGSVHTFPRRRLRMQLGKRFVVYAVRYGEL